MTQREHELSMLARGRRQGELTTRDRTLLRVLIFRSNRIRNRREGDPGQDIEAFRGFMRWIYPRPRMRAYIANCVAWGLAESEVVAHLFHLHRRIRRRRAALASERDVRPIGIRRDRGARGAMLTNLPLLQAPEHVLTNDHCLQTDPSALLWPQVT